MHRYFAGHGTEPVEPIPVDELGNRRREMTKPQKSSRPSEFKSAFGTILFPSANCYIKPVYDIPILKSVRIHFAPGKIAITLELLSQFLRFLDQNDRHSLGVLLIY